MSNLTDALIAAKLVGGSGGSGGGSGGDVGMLIMPKDRMTLIHNYIFYDMDCDDVLAKIQAHPTGWDETFTAAYASNYRPGDPDYDGATADDYEETFILHFGNIGGTSKEPTYDVTFNLYGVHYELSCGIENDTETETGGMSVVINSQSISPLYGVDIVTLISSV